MREQWRLHCTSQWWRETPLSGHVAVAFKMTEQVEQSIHIRSCVKLEHSSMETIQMIQKVFRDDAMSVVQIKVWHKCCKGGWESVESDDPHSGRPATSRTPEHVVQPAINKDQRLTVWELGILALSLDLGIPKTTVSEILTLDLDMKCVVAKFIPWLLPPEKKECHAVVANDLIQTDTNEPDFLKKVTCRDESWVCGCDPETRPSRPSADHLALHAWRRCSKGAAKLQQDQDCVTVFWLERCCPPWVHPSRPNN